MEKFHVKDCNLKRDSITGVFLWNMRHSFYRKSPLKLKVHKQRVLLQIIYYYITGWLLNEAFNVSLWNKTKNSSCRLNAENTAAFVTLDQNL